MRYFARGIFLSLYPPICTVSDKNPNMKNYLQKKTLGALVSLANKLFPDANLLRFA